MFACYNVFALALQIIKRSGSRFLCNTVIVLKTSGYFVSWSLHWILNCNMNLSHRSVLHFYFFFLSLALLDLPVQPSATEVLGFTQTANTSASGLPFRFYEQSRRAPNDPTANRSVFASVDKVPGNTQMHVPSQLLSQTSCL